MKKILIILLLMLCCCTVTFAESKKSGTIIDTIWIAQSPMFYLNGGLGYSGGLASSDDVEDLLDYKVSIFNGHFSLAAKTGFRNIIQIEYRIFSDKMKLLRNEGFEGGSLVQSEIKMKRSVSVLIFKINPFFKKSKGDGLFLMYGIGDSNKFEDSSGDGFHNGKVSIFGVELSRITRTVSNKNFCVTASVALEYEITTYQRFEVSGYSPIEKDCKLSYFRINFGMSFGLPWGN
ncbi:MAG: hypothetical protein K8S23_11675 [Candidatus Cloacimonetes bacterium]|nr:hypothetical protein [Candidatus Cloacimonadota bacterium]